MMVAGVFTVYFCKEKTTLKSNIIEGVHNIRSALKAAKKLQKLFTIKICKIRAIWTTGLTVCRTYLFSYFYYAIIWRLLWQRKWRDIFFGHYTSIFWDSDIQNRLVKSLEKEFEKCRRIREFYSSSFLLLSPLHNMKNSTAIWKTEKSFYFFLPKSFWHT